jgi:hypothetical protein
MLCLTFKEEAGLAFVTVVPLLHYVIMIEAAKTDVWSHWTTLSAKICTHANVRTVQFGPAETFFQAYAVSIEKMNSHSEGRCTGLLERNKGI